MAFNPIIYVRGYAGSQKDVEETVDDPTYGFNLGSTHIRQEGDGIARKYLFMGPLARLIKDWGYIDVVNAGNQSLDKTLEDPWVPKKTIWIYRYYDPTSKTFDDQPSIERWTVEQAAENLAALIKDVKKLTGADKVNLIAHSMGGLVCRSLIQNIYRRNGKSIAADNIDKFFTYGTPHAGINFALGFGMIEQLRDALGINESDTFGPQRLYEILTGKKTKVPKTFDPRDLDGSFPPERIFCIVGTNASDYSVAYGASRTAVGPQSDGLVQIENAYVYGANRAYIHRSHSGRYGMVNSEEAYENLQRFFFGDSRVKIVVCDFQLDFSRQDGNDIAYQLELQIAVRGLPVLMHNRTLAHYCAYTLSVEDKEKKADYERLSKDGLPLFTSFLISSRGRDNTMRIMLRLGCYKQLHRKGFLNLSDHIERLPAWNDYLIIDLTIATEQQRKDTGQIFTARYTWHSQGDQPNTEMKPADKQSRPGEVHLTADLPLAAQSVFGKLARIRFETSHWDGAS
ncbi:MAG TPA: alpha/beta hydrolase [Tepidisphaeraceae bacterium]|jgi:hypothetical protein